MYQDRKAAGHTGQLELLCVDQVASSGAEDCSFKIQDAKAVFK